MTRFEPLAQEAAKLPKEERLARALLDLEATEQVSECEQSWEEEICARVRAVDEGRGAGIIYEDLRREMNVRYGV